MRGYLEDVGGRVLARAPARGGEAGAPPNAGELLVEFGGRACYRSWEPGLNANVTRCAPTSASISPTSCARARQRARARQLLFALRNVSPRVHARVDPASRRLGVQPGEPSLRAAHGHRLPRAARARAGPRAGALDRRAARGVPGRAPPPSSGSTRRASPSTSRRRSPRRCAASRRPASARTSSGPPTRARSGT